MHIFSMNAKRSSLMAALIGVAAAAALAPSAMAQSLKSIRAQQAEQEALNSEVAYTNSICGGSITATIDWKSAANWPDGTSLADACDDALGAVEAICRGSGGKAKGAKIKSFVCKGDSSGASFSGGTLTFGATPGQNGFDAAKAYLEGAL